MTFARTLLAASLAGGLLSGCVAVSQTHLAGRYGEATRQNIAAQIADPDARYRGDPAPGSDGGRVARAQDRYRKGTVQSPVAAASDVGVEQAKTGAN